MFVCMCMYVCMYVFMYVCMHACALAYLRTKTSLKTPCNPMNIIMYY